MIGMNWQKFFMVVGVLTVLYFIVRYVLPIVFSALGILLTVAAYIIIIGGILFVVVMGVGYISRIIHKQQ